MAKEQDLSLTPSTISGICGRLKCCLKFEHEGYLELEKTMPRRGELCECKDGRGRVVDRNLLTQKVTIQLENSTHTVICPASEVSVVYLDKYKMRGGAGQGDPARQKQSGAEDATPESVEENETNPAPQQQKPARQDGQNQNRPHGQQRKQGDRPQHPAGEQRPQNQNRPQQNNQNRPPRPQRQDGGNQNGGNRDGKQNQNRPRRPQQG